MRYSPAAMKTPEPLRTHVPDRGLELSRIRAITLDLDDTLWPIWPTIERAERVLQKSESACLISNSVKSKVTMETTIIVQKT